MVWTKDLENKFDALKKGISEVDWLSSHPYPNKTLIVQTDSSYQGIAGVLFHEEEDG